ncbi:MAG: 30S ribosomal protein S3 [Christensenellales bacterium]|jgi:small subunit ribosomal protein S3
MGQKVSPIGLRLGVNKSWDSTWIVSKKDVAKFIKEDQDIRNFVKKNYHSCGISKISIERTEGKLVVNIHTGRPGMLIGSKGAGIEKLKSDINALVGKDKTVFINVKEIKKPDLDATLVAEGIVAQLERRIRFRRALRSGIQRVMKAGAKGCKVQVSGVVDGANTIARTEKYMEGSLPLHTLRADIDYGVASAFTNYGKLGVKVWIFKGEILNAKERKGGQQ